jgi:hypothetical protein
LRDGGGQLSSGLSAQPATEGGLVEDARGKLSGSYLRARRPVGSENLTFGHPGKVRAVAILHHHGVLGLGRPPRDSCRTGAKPLLAARCGARGEKNFAMWSATAWLCSCSTPGTGHCLVYRVERSSAKLFM